MRKSLPDFRSRRCPSSAIFDTAPRRWKTRPSDFYLTQTIMIFFGIIFSVAAIGFFCWLLFTLAVFALPVVMGVTAGIWAFDTGAGWLGAILVGALATALTFGVGQRLLVLARPLWARIAIALAFVVPTAFFGYHATHGIVKHICRRRAGISPFPLLAQSLLASRRCCG